MEYLPSHFGETFMINVGTWKIFHDMDSMGGGKECGKINHEKSPFVWTKFGHHCLIVFFRPHFYSSSSVWSFLAYIPILSIFNVFASHVSWLCLDGDLQMLILFHPSYFLFCPFFLVGDWVCFDKIVLLLIVRPQSGPTKDCFKFCL